MANTAAQAARPITIVDGSMDFSGGIDSLKVTTIQSARNPNGLGRNQLAWLTNGTVRDGGISQRSGWQPVGRIFGSNGLYQGKYLYEPFNAEPYFVYSISGRIYKVVTNPFSVTDLSAAFGLTN